MEPDAPPPAASAGLHHHHQHHHHHPATHPHQTHVVLGVPAAAPVHYAHHTPTSATPLEGQEVEQWRWCGAGGGGQGGGAHCSITCGREGLVLTYNTQSDAACASLCPSCIPAPLCALGAASPAAHPAPVTAAGLGEGADAAALSRSLGDLSRPLESSAAGRSMTFSGSLDRHTPRTGPQRPYGRRCKSTAHIVLQNNDAAKEPRPHEVHAASGTPHAPSAEARGRARHRTAPAAGRGERSGWQRVEGVGRGAGMGATTCCPCRHWATLCPMAPGASHNPCHPCLPALHHPCPHHGPALLTPCYSPYATASPYPAPREEVGRPASASPSVRTFNSHRCYEEQRRGAAAHQDVTSPTRSPRLVVRRRPSVSPRPSPSPERRPAAREDMPSQGTPQPQRRVPRMGAAAATAAAAAAAAATAPSSAAPLTQEEREPGEIRQRGQRSRPRTIHIDVYCSTSDDNASSSSAASSPTSEEEREPRRPHALVSLGSKQRPKTEVSLTRRHHHHQQQRRPLEQRTSSFVYSRPAQPQSAPRSTFITDDDLPLCSTPTEARPAPSTSSTRLQEPPGRSPSDSRRSPIPMPAPPQRPTSLAVPPCTVLSADPLGDAPRSHHSSLSYLSSPLEGDPWEGDLWEAEPDLSWRGSEFETSTPRLTSDADAGVARPASEVSLASLHEAAGDASPRLWRSPQVERQRYMQRDQEDRYREALKRRTQQQQQQQQQAEAQRSLSGTPTSAARLAQLSAFRDFSRDDLQVISKSLERRESQQSLRQQDALSLPHQRESFRPVVEQDANRLLEWMQQYKEQESRASAPAPNQPTSLAKAKSDCQRGEHAATMDRKESYCSVGRRRSFPGSSGAWGPRPVVSVRRGDSLRTLERRRDAPRHTSQLSAPTPTRPLEKKDSFKFQDKQQYFRSLERHDSATQTLAPTRRGSGRVERRGSGRLCGDAALASPTRAWQCVDLSTLDSRPASGLRNTNLDQDSHTSSSAEWQDGMATVRRRLSTSARDTVESSKYPATGLQHPPQDSSQSPSAQRRRTRVSPPRTEGVGGRPITVGAFRHLSRFPFSQTMPVTAARMLEAARTACVPEERRFVRPQLFGEMTSSYPSRRGIHYGPPRNPQCSCRNCRAWTDQAGDDTPGGRVRAWSLSDLDSGAAEDPAAPPQRPATSLSRTSSSLSDHTPHPHVGAAAAGREQS